MDCNLHPNSINSIRRERVSAPRVGSDNVRSSFGWNELLASAVAFNRDVPGDGNRINDKIDVESAAT